MPLGLNRFRRWFTVRPWHPYLAALLLVAVASGAGAVVVHHLDPTNLVMLYLLAVVITGLRWGRGAAVFASILGVLTFDFFFVPPHLTFAVANAQYFITFAALLVVALVIGTLTGRLREHAAMLRCREQETAALYAFSRTMIAAPDLPSVTRALVSQVSEGLGHPAAVLLPEQGRLTVSDASPGFSADARDLAVAEQTCATGQPSGWAGPSHSASTVGCIPIRTAHGVIGVLAVQMSATGAPVSSGHRGLMETFTAQAAIIMERIELAEAARRAHLLEEAERLHDALLHSISHALRTPLAAIIGSLSTLADPMHANLGPEVRTELLDTAREEAERLNWLVRNLLDMTRLESGHLKLTMDWHDIEDVLGVALGQTAASLGGRPVHVRIPDKLPLVPLDQVLIVQVVDNLLTNAAKYSPPGSPIEIEVRTDRTAVAIQVADRGPGISASDRERIFEKFYRVEQPGNPSGTGLGLAICKGIVEAHRGRIEAEPRAGGGTMIIFTLPLQQQAPGSEVQP